MNADTNDKGEGLYPPQKKELSNGSFILELVTNASWEYYNQSIQNRLVL